MPFNKVGRIPDLVPVRKVLISVYDKRGLEELARGLAASCPDVQFYATGGTYAALRAALDGRGVVSISEYTGQPEMAGGLVKTLDWRIYLGLLAETGDPQHEADLARHRAVSFDLVVVNLYPFAEVSADPSSSPEELRQRIDIGGAAMLRAAAKNYLRVAAVSDPSQYPALAAELDAQGGWTRLEYRRRLAVSAFGLTSRFDEEVSRRLELFDPAAIESEYGLD
jgi:phosphoribosylaminoimidazolecarboxamide formyltransferase/IMP cyclohydrolase